MIGTEGLAPSTSDMSRRRSATELRPASGCGAWIQTKISDFKGQRPIIWTTPQNIIGAAGFEPASRAGPALTVYKTVALPIELCPA